MHLPLVTTSAGIRSVSSSSSSFFLARFFPRAGTAMADAAAELPMVDSGMMGGVRVERIGSERYACPADGGRLT